MAKVTHFECSECKQHVAGEELVTLCPHCQRPYLARYDLEPLSRLTPASFPNRSRSLWRYSEVLPLAHAESPTSLGEGFTPLLTLERLGRHLGLNHLMAKNEGLNPTGSFKDRGMAVAIHAAWAKGVPKLCLPSAGNAAGSASAYARRAGLEVQVAMPGTTPFANRFECEFLGVKPQLVDGSLREAGAVLREQNDGSWFDLSTLKEPFRLEGKKTMGYELYEQGSGELPDVILYPTGGGTGLIGMWKAFDELESAGLISKKPRMISVQAEGCAPIVQAFHAGHETADPIENPTTIAAGLRVPVAVGDKLMLKTLRESGGTAIAISDPAMFHAAKLLGKTEGILTSLEAAAAIAALTPLRDQGLLQADERIVVFLTASALKNLSEYRELMT